METQSQGQSSTRISDLPVWQGQQVPPQVPPHVTQQAPQQVPQQQQFSYNPQVPQQIPQQQHQFKGQTSGELPSRDIPTHTQPHVVDESSKTNYVPKPEKQVHFVEEDENESDLNENLERNEKFESSIFRYKEPIILALLFFIFQMSIVNAKLYQYVPKLFVQEGELSGFGVIVKAGFFVAFYLGVQYTIKHGMKVV